jgi:TrmH family RNA methyltransferase
MLENVRIVLIGTTHPGNIGAAARAMKTMCLDRLCLVSPKHFPSAEATARASGADDLLARADVFGELDEALSGCRLVVGTSARLRSVEWPVRTPRECAAELLGEAQRGPVAILFGRESSGLSNAELDRCRYLVQVPANPVYSSLNLGTAVQVLAYELYQQASALAKAGMALEQRSPATADQLEGFYDHLSETLRDLEFTEPGRSTKLLRRLRRLFNRAELDADEVNILRGILSAAQNKKNIKNNK